MATNPLDLTGFFRPKLALSACLGFVSCRYDGTGFPSPLPRRFFDWAVSLPFCPEVQAGLGTPRTPIQWVLPKGRPQVVDLNSGLDQRPKLEQASAKLLETLGEPEGVLLKARSPSCALTDCPRFLPDSSIPTSFGSGVFGGQLLALERPWILATEEQVKTPWGFELWAAGLFQLARLNALPPDLLVPFHRQQTSLLKGLGVQTALEQSLPNPQEYARWFALAFASPPQAPEFLARLGLGDPSAGEPLRLDQLATLLGVSGQSLNCPYPPPLREP